MRKYLDNCLTVFTLLVFSPVSTTLAAPFACADADPVADGRQPRIGLVLGGGGARGAAHIGVIRELERMQIPIHAIAGTSMGAIVGGLYASGMTVDEIEMFLLDTNWPNIFDPDTRREHARGSRHSA